MNAKDRYTFDAKDGSWNETEEKRAHAKATRTGLGEPHFFQLTALREGPPEEVITSRGGAVGEPYPAFIDEDTTKVVIPTISRSKPPPPMTMASMDDLFLPPLPELVESASVRAARLRETVPPAMTLPSRISSPFGTFERDGSGLTPAQGLPRRFLGTPVRMAVAAAAGASLLAAMALAVIAPAARGGASARANANAKVSATQAVAAGRPPASVPLASLGASIAAAPTLHGSAPTVVAAETDSPHSKWPLSPAEDPPESKPAASGQAHAAPSAFAVAVATVHDTAPRASSREPSAPRKLATPSEVSAREGDAALSRGAVDDARRAYRDALAQNPSYVPARVGLADATWLAGDHAGAEAIYAKIVAEVPAHLVPARARERAGDAAPAPAVATKAKAKAEPSPIEATGDSWVPTAP